MENLNTENPHLITYTNSLFTIDVLCGISLENVERLDCTLRITYRNYSPKRIALNLYDDNQCNSHYHSICNDWKLKLTEVARVLNKLTFELEEYRLRELKYLGKKKPVRFNINEEDKEKAITFLKSHNLESDLAEKFERIGVLGEEENAFVLFLALASHKLHNPFSVLCHASSGIGKSYLLQKLSRCMPENTYSFHSYISENALYYFDSCEVQNKALIIEDLEWTNKMIQPLSTLQSQGKLIKTRATKDKEGNLHSTTFEVNGNLCLVACTQSDKNVNDLNLPFLSLHLDHSPEQDLLVMDYQKKIKAGIIDGGDIDNIEYELKCVMATLECVSIINPFAMLIDLPKDVPHPRKASMLLLNFIDVITYFYQYQRENIVDESTGEIFIKTHPDDIALAYKLLKKSLMRKADELSLVGRDFHSWLLKYVENEKLTEFTNNSIREFKKELHPKTLNRRLNELIEFNYVKIVGGNRYRGGFIYQLTNLTDQTDINSRIDTDIKKVLKLVNKAYKDSKTKAHV